ncbi:hypothetical protein K6119_06120 [Paracrocinitomix mangrovi]|uniref:hypothetical protein n=1 Tax=Paracrocinitomix mangrovi TaxID=2862509 RepID=UPI001C8F11A4|nr:hypothetical protein [Paracrocinitomix mangrovi]UKN03087.1 hypothetical protein K6119_06120 [Paracrocinitomix mangrovi]
MPFKILTITIFASLFFTSYGQDSPNYYAQFKVLTITQKEEALKIDKKIATKKGIISTHTDHLTSTFFCTMTGDVDYDMDDFTSWFSKLGYEITCFNKGIQGDDRMISPHELKKCEKSNIAQ